MNLAHQFKGPLGQKTGKAGPKKPKPLPRRSKKRIKYAASEECAEGIAHMMRVKCLPCVCCGRQGPSEAHHTKDDDSEPRSHFRTIPLCPPCHTGPHGYHTETKTWRATYGLDVEFLAVVADALAGELNK